MFTLNTLIDLCIIKCKEEKHFYMHCLQCFTSEEIFTNRRKAILESNGKLGVNMSKTDINVKFSNFHKLLAARFVTYADFESNIKKFKNLIEIVLIHPILITIKIILLINGCKVVCTDEKFSKPVRKCWDPNVKNVKNVNKNILKKNSPRQKKLKEIFK